MELSTYFRINAANTGQFERTLIVAEEDSYVSYLEGCTAPMRDENQLHAQAIVAAGHAVVGFAVDGVLLQQNEGPDIVEFVKFHLAGQHVGNRQLLAPVRAVQQPHR
jgi:hypothetical protein